MRSRVPALALALATFAGCTVADDTTPSDPPPDDPGAVMPDGTRGSMQVKLTDGVVTANYVVRGGRMMWEGDIDLGPATEATVYGFAIKGMDHRWPDGVVPFVFEEPFSDTDMATMRAAAAEWSRITPVKFHEGKIAGRPYIAFRVSTQPGSFTTGLGPDGIGDQDETNVNIHPGSAQSTVMHELGHALGLKHEHMRPDRNDHVLYRPDCVISDERDQFDLETSSSYKTMGAYDIESIMHYSATGWCQPPYPGLPPVTQHGNCVCYPLLNLDTFDGVDQETGWYPTPGRPSDQDIRVITRMYEPVLGATESGDQLGAAMASGDFDGDGFKDLAVGVPGEVFNGAPNGEVDLYRGTGVGLVAWGFITPSSVTAGTTPEAGFAVAAADLDNDGTSDLIIGRPGEGPGAIEVILSTEGGGPLDPAAVRLRLGGNNGSGSPSTDPDRFGAALAVGDVTGDNVADIAVGAPNGMNGSVKSGYVQTVRFDRSSGTLVRIQRIQPPAATQATNDRFGAAVAIVDVDDTTRSDLIVGAPGLASGSKPGSVFVYRAGTTSTVTLDQTLTEGTTGADAAAPGDRFGAAIAWSKTPANWPETLPNGKQPQIIIGAPGKDNPTDSGRVIRFVPSFGAFDAYTGLARTQVWGQGQISGQANQAGDGFGSELALADFDRDDVRELIVGVPGKDLNSTFVNAGVIDIFTASSAGTYSGVQQVMALNNVPWETFGQDKYGSTVAVGDYDSDGIPDMVVAAPARSSSSGRIYTYTGPSSGVVPTLNARFDQDTATPE